MEFKDLIPRVSIDSPGIQAICLYFLGSGVIYMLQRSPGENIPCGQIAEYLG